MTPPQITQSQITPPARRLRPFRRHLWETVTTSAMLIGFVMLMQPLWMALYTASFGVILFGVLGFVVASRLPE